METRSHQRLKHLTVAFLREHGCRAVATEVRCPLSRWRVDVAGYVDTAPAEATGASLLGVPVHDRRWKRCPPRTVVVECKQSRSDFLRDRRDRDELIRRRADLDRVRQAIERRAIRTREPELRRSDTSLFPDLEDWDFASSRLPAYRAIVRRLRRVDAMLHGETKFCMIARYALADRLYLAAPAGMIRRREIPPGWGLLECPRRSLGERDADPNADLFGGSILRIVVRAPDRNVREERRQRLLRNIAVAASGQAAGSMGILA